MKLSALRVSNFKKIGAKPVEILIDDIVILIGPNNAGKSSILDAYEAFASGSASQPIANFHNESDDKPIEIQGIFTDITDEDEYVISKKWKHHDKKLGECILIKYSWERADSKGTKYTWDPGLSDWKKGGSGGMDSLLLSRIPQPLRINPTDSHQDREKQVVAILTEAVKASLKQDSTKISSIISEIESLADQVAETFEEEIEKVCGSVEERLSQVFSGHKVKLQRAAGKVEPEKIIGAGSHIRIANHQSDQLIPLASQGTGLQRAFLWSALGILADMGKVKKGRTYVDSDKPKILLIDEPESFLHPPAVRNVRESLYRVSELSGWQVMASTHSPILIDVSKPHTTIIRIESYLAQGARVFQSDEANFSDDERIVLQMVRACHPSVNEFFFSDSVVLVEGATEVAILEELRSQSNHPDASDLHIVNCLGKANLVLFSKILNQFGSSYTVIHDADSKKIRNKKCDSGYQRNPAWTINEKICETVSKSPSETCHVLKVSHIPDFETFYFGQPSKQDKPFTAVRKLKGGDYKNDLDKLFDQLLSLSHPGQYSNVDELAERVSAYAKTLNGNFEAVHNDPKLYE